MTGLWGKKYKKKVFFWGLNKGALKGITPDKKKKENEEKSFSTIFIAILFKQSYTIAIFILLYISFYTTNLIHLILISISLVLIANAYT